jgi:hypothetical protein
MDCRPKKIMTKKKLLKKRQNTRKKDYDLLQDGSVLPSGKPPHDNTATVLTTSKIWSWIPEGLTAKTDGLTDDWPSVAK